MLQFKQRYLIDSVKNRLSGFQVRNRLSVSRYPYSYLGDVPESKIAFLGRFRGHSLTSRLIVGVAGENLEGQLKLIENALRDLRAEISNTAGAAWDAVAAAGVAPQPEPEYEYGPGYKEANGRWFSLDGAFTVREAAEHSLNNYADDPQVHLLRRVKAGAWEPVPNQSDGSES